MPPGNQSARQPRVLPIASSSPAHHDEPESPITPGQPPREIPPFQFARIRTLVKYGMTVAQVAQVYGVAIDEIARILRRG